MKKCDICKGSFKNAHGVSIHKLRSRACGGKTWGNTAGRTTKRKSTGNRPRGTSGESGKEAIREILANHPQGLGTSEIRTQLEARGFRLNANYIFQAAASSPGIVRVDRGKYRLRGNVARRLQKSGTTVVKEAVEEAKSVSLPREALLLRIETLETQNRALQDAHMSLIRGVFV